MIGIFQAVNISAQALKSQSHLLFLSSNQILPFVDGLAEVHAVHGNLDLTDDVVFAKAVKIEHLEHQRLTAQIRVWYLDGRGGGKSDFRKRTSTT